MAELLVGTFTASLLLGGSVVLLHQSARVVDDLVSREESVETLRTTWTVLHEELGAGLRGRDWDREEGTDRALWLRAFRGIALPCEWEPGSREGRVTWRGHRAPDPDRDSVLVLEAEGGWRLAALEAVSSAGGACLAPLEGQVAQWRLSERVSGPILIRYFERGRYSLEDRAFRYRRGDEGRQPLTPERVGPASAFEASEGGGLDVILELQPGGEVRWKIPWSGPPGPPWDPSPFLPEVP
ncbi:MAG: hypothetical protein EA421_10355 [Gemmatimonadales bacterium]|nr:MAG: hypothetical protein EA421_10355 [Gemmatimonadales bacterium]